MLSRCIAKIVRGEDLSAEESADAMEHIVSDEASPARIADYLSALCVKGETVDEITGAARTLRKHSLKVKLPKGISVDLCGTGGDYKDTFNISTITSFVLAAAGVIVAKHGNRASSGRCGSADLLEGLGVNIGLLPPGVENCINKIRMGFMFAPVFHPSMKRVAAIRKEMGIRTIFNLLGPLTNPAQAETQLVGVFSKSLLVPYANVLRALGVNKAIIVHGEGGYDEATTTGINYIARLEHQTITEDIVDPQTLGLPKADSKDLVGGDINKNIVICREILQNGAGPRHDTVLLNASLALVITGKAADYKEGLALARETIASGGAEEVLERLVTISNEVA